MTLTHREFWTAIHGLILGSVFLLAFTGTAFALWNLRSEWTTPAGQKSSTRTLLLGSWSMALLAWMTVSIGTFVVYPWYRATAPKGTPSAMLAHYPKAVLVADPQTKPWHTLGMEWKEHIGWLAPMFATSVAIVATLCRKSLAHEAKLRQAMLALLTASFFCASVAGLFGAFINKMAPVR